MPPDQVLASHITETVALVNRSSWQPSTRWTAFQDIKHLLRDLVLSGAKAGLCSLVPMPAKPAPRPVTLPVTALDSLILTSPPWLRLFILLCHDTALRAGTAATLTRRCYDSRLGEIVVVGKRGTVTRVPVSGRLRALLLQCPPGDGPLVSLLAGRSMGYFACYKHFKAQCATHGLPRDIHPHDLRRTMAEVTYRVCGDLRVIQTLLGHDALNSTLHYLQRPMLADISGPMAAAIAEGCHEEV
ncbi:MAG TPA: site-specific integrase [Acidobacteriaceae bacterium]